MSGYHYQPHTHTCKVIPMLQTDTTFMLGDVNSFSPSQVSEDKNVHSLETFEAKQVMLGH